MRQLLLLRHARAGSGLGLDDHERPLTEDGRSDAERMGGFLLERDLHPDLALCSSARRARETLDALRAHGGSVGAVELERGLYEADAEGLLARLSEVEDEVRRCLLVGHQPAIGELGHLLTGEADPVALDRLHRGHPAGALVLLGVPCERWADLRSGALQLLELVIPEDLG